MAQDINASLERIEGYLLQLLQICQKWAEREKEEGYKEESISLGTLFKEEINKEEKEREKKKTQRKIFVKPTLEEIKAYIAEKGLHLDADYFYDHYESNGWCVGNAKMKDWRATLRKWEARRNPNSREYRPELKGHDPFADANVKRQFDVNVYRDEF